MTNTASSGFYNTLHVTSAGQPGSKLSLILRYLKLINVSGRKNNVSLYLTPSQIEHITQLANSMADGRELPPTPPENYALEAILTFSCGIAKCGGIAYIADMGLPHGEDHTL